MFKLTLETSIVLAIIKEAVNYILRQAINLACFLLLTVITHLTSDLSLVLIDYH